MAYSYYRRAFDEADRNRDGFLDFNEFRNFNNFEYADRNRDGRINLQEFTQVAAPTLGIHPKQAAQAFYAADVNHDGYLSRRELADLSDFQRADLNRDGRIDPHEMRLYLGNKQARWY